MDWLKESDMDHFIYLSRELSKRNADNMSFVSGVTGATCAPNTMGVRSDVEACDKVLELYPHWVYCQDILYVFDDTTGLWTTKEATFHKIIRRFERELTFLQLKQGEHGVKWIKTTRSYGSTLSLMKNIPVLIKSMTMDDDWLRRKENTSLGKLLFHNGYYDGHTQTFHDKFDPNILFF